MKGHIRERSPGRWAIILDAHDPETGKRKRRWHSFRGTKRAAQIECARLVNAMQSGSTIEPNKIKVRDFLDQWLTDIRARVAPKTHERYASLIRANIKPALGGIVLVKLEPGLSAKPIARRSSILRHAPCTICIAC